MEWCMLDDERCLGFISLVVLVNVRGSLEAFNHFNHILALLFNIYYIFKFVLLILNIHGNQTLNV